jgi:acetate CoA/acetoacetate CoA-transferase beta subunit
MGKGGLRETVIRALGYIGHRGTGTAQPVLGRIAHEIRAGMLVNLGIWLPRLVSNHLPDDAGVLFQAENGVIGSGSRPSDGMEDANLTGAGGGFVTVVPGADSIDSAMAFGLIRGGHLDMTVLGVLQVDEEGHLANWMIPGRMVPGMGGALDLVASAWTSSSPTSP